MRKTLVTMVVIGLVAGSFAAPATAQKKKQKKVEESFTAQALPFPNLSSATETEDRGCLAGIEGVNKVSHAFTTPGAGTLTAHMAGFVGDWDLFITDAEGKEIDGSVNDQALDMAPAEEKVTVKLKKGQDVHIVPCNWLGAPQAEIHIEYVYR
jgi:hypothetical protein